MTATRFLRDKPPTLEEAQAAVGGNVQMLTLENGDQMLMDEDGRLKKLPINVSATKRAKEYGNVVGSVLILVGPARWTHE